MYYFGSKKIVSLFLSLALLSVFTVSAFAETKNTQGISPSTVITEENIGDVLSYFGLASSNFKKSDKPLQSNIKTVGDLAIAINQAKSKGSRKKSTEKKKESLLKSSSSSGTIMLYRDDDFTDYTLRFQVAAYYSGTKFTGVGASDVSMATGPVGVPVIYKVDSKQLNAKLVDSNTIQLDATTVVGFYVPLSLGTLEIGSEPIDSTIYWYANQEL